VKLNDERGTVSFLGLCMMMTVLTLGMGLVYAAKRQQDMIGGNLWETRLSLAADGALDAVAGEILRDSAATESNLPLGSEICLRESAQNNIEVKVYARRTSQGIFLLSLAESRGVVRRAGMHKRRQAYLIKGADGKYEWGGFLP